MRTLVDSVETDPPRFQNLAKAVNYRLRLIFGDEPAPNTGLITDNNQQKSTPAQLGERFHHARQQLDIRRPSDIAVIDDQGSVAVEKERTARRVAQ